MSEKATRQFDAAYFRSRGWWRDETLPGWLDSNALGNGGTASINTFDRVISYSELKDRAYNVASALRGLGIGRGDIVAVHLPNIPEFVIAWLAINACGAVMQTIH